MTAVIATTESKTTALRALTALPQIARWTREQRGLSQRAAAKEIGISFSTLSRVESYQDCLLSVAVRILEWARATPKERAS